MSKKVASDAAKKKKARLKRKEWFDENRDLESSDRGIKFCVIFDNTTDKT